MLQKDSFYRRLVQYIGNQSRWQPKHKGLGRGKVRSKKQGQKHQEAYAPGRMLNACDEGRRRAGRERREHGGCIHEGGRDDWTQVKHIGEGETITMVGNAQKQEGNLKQDES